MVYTATHFRKNMGEILDDIRFNRKIESIWRRKRREFVIVPIEIWEEHNYDEMFDTQVTKSMDWINKKGGLQRFDTMISKMEKQWKL